MLFGLVPGLSGKFKVGFQPQPLTVRLCPVNPLISSYVSCALLGYDYTLIIMNCIEPECNIHWPAFV